MKTAVALVFLLVGVTTVFGEQWIDYRLVADLEFLQGRSTQPPGNVKPTCTTAGRVCDADCKNIWICANNGGELKPSLIETCSGEQTCNAGVCSDTPTPECSPAGQKAFVCRAEGVFPDPMTCKKYHYCIENAPTEFDDHARTCEKNYGYNSGTTYCAKNLTNDHCGADYPVPICTMPAQHGALKDNKSLYYVCSLYEDTGNILYPYLYLCPRGQVYDNLYGCK